MKVAAPHPERRPAAGPAPGRWPALHRVLNGLCRRLYPGERLQRLAALPGLARLRHRPSLWQVSRRTVALGAAIGVFFGLLLPFAQIPLAALFAYWLRANLPAAVAGTLVSNPLTVLPLYAVAHAAGTALLEALGQPPDESFSIAALATAFHVGDVDVGTWLKAVYQPLLPGLLLLATAAATLTYAALSACWDRIARRSNPGP